MKCLVLAPEYPPTKGGIANAAAMFTKNMARKGWTMEVFTRAWQELPTKTIEEEGSIHRFNISGDASIWGKLGGDVERCRELSEKFGPDVVVIHGWQEWCVLMAPFFFEKGIPVILQGHSFTYHRVSWNPRPPFGLRRWVGYQPFIWKMPEFIGKLHALVVLSKKPDFKLSFDHWMGQRFAPGHVHTIPNGASKPCATDEAIFAVCPEARGKRIILNVANYSDTKNQLMVIDIATQLADANTFFLLIGGEENNYLKEVRLRIKRFGLSARVAAFTGLPRATTESAINACDVALLTSKTEMQPLFLLEAMSIGKPWICTDVGCVKELHGGWVARTNALDMAKKIKLLLADAELYSSLSNAALAQWQAEFDPQIVYSVWEDLLTSAVQKTPLNDS